MRALRLVCLWLAAGLSPAAGAALDELGMEQVRGLYPTLRWDNVEQAPAWVAGARPRYRTDLGRHLVTLPPGARSVVRLAAGGWLRIHRPGAALSASDLELALSDGSRLYLVRPPLTTPQGHDLLLRNPAATPRLARLRRPATAGSALEVGLYTARREALPGRAEYRAPVALEGARGAILRRAGELTGVERDLLRPGRTASARLPGPGRYALRTRLLYTPNETRPEQAYRVYVRTAGGRLLRTLRLSTGPAYRDQWDVDTRPRLTGREEWAYLEVPAGTERLTLEATRPLLAGLLWREPEDLLQPWNRPPGEVGPRLPPPLADAPEALVHAAAEPRWPARQAAAAGRIARENRRQGGGLLAAALLRHGAERRPGLPEVRRRAETLLGRHTDLFDLLPETPAAGPVAVAVTPPRLREPGDRRAEVVLGEAQRATLARRAARAWLTPLEGRATLRYRVPPRAAESELWVWARARPGTTARLGLELGAAAPVALDLQAEADATPADYALQPIPAAASQGLRATPNGPPRRLTPAPDRTMSRAVLRLPAGVERVAIRRLDGGAETLAVGLQYRRAIPYRLSESEYLAARRSLGGDVAVRALLARALAALPGLLRPESGAWERVLGARAGPRREAATDLVQHWVPLLRRLAGRLAQYRSAVARPPERADRRLAPANTARLERTARTAMRERRWVAAIEAWSALAKGLPRARRGPALLGEARALEAEGEAYLYERALRALLLYPPEATSAHAAYARLAAHYRRSGDLGALEGLYAHIAQRGASAGKRRAALVALAELYLERGEARAALDLGIALAGPNGPHELLAEASWQARWWRVFATELEALQGPEERALWRGYQAQARGHPEEALAHWARAGADGRALITALRRVPPASPESRGPWRAWETSLPGPRVWRPLPEAVRAHAGAESLYNPARGLYLEAFRATPERPLRLRVEGPVWLRLAVHPLHRETEEGTLEDWLVVREGEGERVAPILANAPSRTLRRQAGGGLGAGQAYELYLGPGGHELEIAARGHAALVRPAVLSPRRPLTGLGPESGGPVQRPAADCRRVAESELWRCRRHLPPLPPEPSAAARSAAGPVAAPRPRPLSPGVWPLVRPALGEPEGTRGRTPPPGRLREALVLGLWRLEQGGGESLGTMSHLLALAGPAVSEPGLGALLARARVGFSWQPVPYVTSSAGLRLRELRGWQPEDPALRVRRALHGLAGKGQEVVIGHQVLELALHSTAARTLSLRLARSEIGFLPPRPLVAMVSIDDRPPRPVTLEAEAPARDLELRLASGDHHVQVRIHDPIANQYLRVSVAGQEGLIPERERTYQVATRAEPLRLDLEGPGWLRVDELRGRTLYTHYRPLRPGWQGVELRPATSQGEALLRLHTLAGAPPRPRARPRRVIVPVTAPAPPLLRLARRIVPRRARLVDAYPLGGQEDGTWSLHAAAVSRRNLEEDRETGPEPEELVEIGARYRYLDAPRKLYLQGGFLTRAREQGGPTLGLFVRARWAPARTRLRLSTSLQGFVQAPGGPHLGGDGPAHEWSLLWRARASQHLPITPKTYHVPAASLFLRALSLDRPRYAAGRVDQDVFTTYKRQHRRGLEISERLVHEPWRDTQLWARTGLTSNEDLDLRDPDHLSLSAGLKHLAGPLQLDLEYAYRRYFNDGDRSRLVTRRTLGLDLDGTLWRAGQRRLNGHLRLRHDRGSGENSVMLTLEWHGGAGRAYRDFAPGEVDFEALREPRSPRRPDNALEPLDE